MLRGSGEFKEKSFKYFSPYDMSTLRNEGGLGLFSQAVNAVKETVVVSSLIICTNYLK